MAAIEARARTRAEARGEAYAPVTARHAENDRIRRLNEAADALLRKLLAALKALVVATMRGRGRQGASPEAAGQLGPQAGMTCQHEGPQHGL